MSPAQRREMVDRAHPSLSLVRQCALLGVSRSNICCRPKAASEEDLSLMGEIDRQYLETPFYGSRRMSAWLGRCGVRVSRKRVQRLDARHGTAGHLPASQHQPQVAGATGLSLPVKECENHPVQPEPAPDPDRGCGPRTSPTCPCPRGVLYPVTVMDWYSRYVLAWRLSNTLEAGFCAEALEDSLGQAEVFNADQGSQFTSLEFTQAIKDRGVRISMGEGGGTPTTSSWNGCGGR